MKIIKITAAVLLSMLALIAIVPLLIPVPPLEDTVDPEQLADPDSRFMSVQGIKVHYKMAGEGSTVLVLLHGFGASTFSWHAVLPELAKDFTVIAYDRPAFGLTQRLMEWQGQNPYGQEGQVEMLAAVLDALGVRKAVLVGNSMGGSIATAFALKYPDRVQALVEVDAAIYSGGSPSFLSRFGHLPQIDHLGPLLVRSIKTRGNDLITMAWHDPAKITPQTWAGYQKPLQVTDWDRALWELTKAPQGINLAGHLSELKLPVLVITGDDDRIVPTAQSIQLAKDIPGAKLVVISEAGHVPHEEQPTVFLTAVMEFISHLQE